MRGCLSGGRSLFDQACGNRGCELYASTISGASSADDATTDSSASLITDITQANSAENVVTYDDWNYQSSTLSISINEYSSGSGENALTYFVADVVITDATQLMNAFADNQFGQNIIAYTSEIAQANNAIFAINGDYYGFRDNGIIIRNGIIYRDIPVRTGLVFYRDGSMKIYDETQTSAEELLADGVWNTLSFGPALLEDYQVVENNNQVEVDTNFGNHPIQGNQPRTGIGIIDENHIVFIVVDGRSKGYSMGVTLTELQKCSRPWVAAMPIIWTAAALPLCFLWAGSSTTRWEGIKNAAPAIFSTSPRNRSVYEDFAKVP